LKWAVSGYPADVDEPTHPEPAPAATPAKPPSAGTDAAPASGSSSAPTSGAATGTSQAVAGTGPAATTSTMVVIPGGVPGQRKPMGRAPVIFAIASLVVALVAGGIYVLRQVNAPPALTPAQTIDQFLSAVFLADDPTRVAPLVCSSWSGQEAFDRTSKQVGPGVHVSWADIRIVTTSDTEVSATALLGLRQADDKQPSAFKQWRFGLKKEKGWRICDASPFDA
jgi:hypothetical protein